jgi:hypothetical protein
MAGRPPVADRRAYYDQIVKELAVKKKLCTGPCGEMKALGAFRTRPNYRWGVDYLCKVCRRRKHKQEMQLYRERQADAKKKERTKWPVSKPRKRKADNLFAD